VIRSKNQCQLITKSRNGSTPTVDDVLEKIEAMTDEYSIEWEKSSFILDSGEDIVE
jgi:hypothetical protein